MPWIVVKKNGKKHEAGFVLTNDEVRNLDNDPRNTYVVQNTTTYEKMTVGKRKGRALAERGGGVDEDAVDELVLFIENDGDLYHRRTQPIMKNLAKKMVKGVYEHDKAVKLWKYLADDGAKKYTKEFGTEDSPIFSVATRKAAAEELASAFEREAKEDPDYLRQLAGVKASERSVKFETEREASAFQKALASLTPNYINISRPAYKRVDTDADNKTVAKAMRLAGVRRGKERRRASESLFKTYGGKIDKQTLTKAQVKELHKVLRREGIKPPKSGYCIRALGGEICNHGKSKYLESGWQVISLDASYFA